MNRGRIMGDLQEQKLHVQNSFYHDILEYICCESSLDALSQRVSLPV